ncbi:TrlF family AAA-like ATPase [Pseudonocardia pini]|uniref:TrlF family AAA-like ATPase n=1 Tax=Pseudonocardia pini TaxID=2758030 RepID=UPI0015EFEF0D|nr:AAA family ATPase [Pseudonocardia pini]
MLDTGAHYYRADFQVHTPRDTNWAGARAITEEDRRAYAEEFVSACRTRGLQAVAITDHHDFAIFPFIREAAASEVDANGVPFPVVDRLVVFPGLELTLAVPCQAILILDADFPEEKLSSVLEALAIAETDPTAERLPPVTRLDHIQSFEDLYSTLDTRPWLRGRYTVFPNVTDGGYKTLMRSGMHAKYKSMPCVGGYLDGTVDSKAKPTSGNRRIFDGLDTNWGAKRIGLFQTSDSRSRDFKDLGKNSSWVKWAEPTAEALRQACLAQESRISHVEPALPNIFISGVHVSNSSFLGPFDLAFNRQYNALIGGRGTGKSTILDYIRWCIGDVPTGTFTDEGAPSADARRQRLISATLASVDGQVEVTFVLNGIEHIVRRSAKSGEMLLKIGAGEFARVNEIAVQALLPIHAYSQKQLSSVAVLPEELTRFITAPIRQKLQDKDDATSDTANRLRQNYAALRRSRAVAGDIRRAVANEQSLLDQAAYLRRSLAGLSEQDQKILSDRPIVDGSREVIAYWRRSATGLADRVTATLGEVDRLMEQLPAPTHDAPGELLVAMERARESLIDTANQIRSVLQPAQASVAAAVSGGGNVGEALVGAEAILAELDSHYEDVKSRSASQEQQLTQLAEIETRRMTAAEQLVALRQESEVLGNPESIHRELRQHLVDLYAERSGLLLEQCRIMTEQSEGLLKAEVIRGQGLEQVEVRFRALASGSGIRAARFEGLFAALAAESSPLDTWETVLGELEQLTMLDESVELTTELTPTLSRLGLPVADQQRLRGRVTVDSWLDLALTPIEDKPVFSYRTKEQEYIEFAAASAGQQATALLRVLLAQTGMPLLIDQPEEDLDSQIIEDVVTWLWESKSRRQVIVASHNANLVVNGDAELVAVCDYRRAGDQSGGRIKLTGAIDVAELRDEITHVMEGGERAFKLRRDKYGF